MVYIKTGNYSKNIQMIVKNDAELLDYLLRELTGKSKNNVKSLLVRGNVEINGQPITKYNYPLRKGQKIIIKTAQIHDKKVNDKIDIIYEDNDLVVINKPAGLLSIATEDEKSLTAYKLVMNYLKQHNHGSKIFVVHRLDRETSGILVFAKNEKIKYALQEKWDDLVITRGYIAIVEGKLDKTQDTIESWLRETTTMLVYSSRTPGDGKHAITHYQKIKENNRYTMLSIKIDTGRKNQIRVHMKDIGHSIIGDKKYGSKSNPIGRLGLHANVLEFKHPITNKILRFETGIPNEFRNLIK